ncbi:DNA-binding response regulator [Virgibacillus pantothenticus]|uniref:LuxR family transcriptional regulator n=1 Tax=Virgibacillus pantothenticus TaxID=1473 RepID=A0A0L0QTN6_VIRPA|nr:MULTISPECIES: response regulator transcription factor [Virgibacillus]API91154.1 DNA-binding response regulator [Virgibacillus sp. 6R]KNE21892.1 LuxR family transcriptional regulator [Virgibacillus pantothenticus]MBS7429145.1 response regulator transcription factor [Virgibacillus sp. 19R1-5]MBU8566827.1 response regulator transcription factor [Virgibacillus pantothenticus]MBU8600480.1 response regulator transcription factor [Virgibacillus pantothenticus]
MWRILIVEDQVIVRQGLKIILEQDERINVPHEAENGKEAIEILEQHLVDLVMMDVRMPIMNGIEATRIIKQKWPSVKILVLTTFNDDEYALSALKEGADGFLLKTTESKKLIEAVHSCMRGGMTIHDEVAAKVMPRLLKGMEQKKIDLSISLSDRELLITRLVGEGKTNKEIAQTLHLSIGTVKNHLTQILQKTNLRDRTQLAIFAVKHDLTY